jgi:iron complex outermembrane receptor protein
LVSHGITALLPVFVIAAITAATPTASFAQTRPEEPGPEDIGSEQLGTEAEQEKTPRLEEIVVTARKKEESLQEVPLSVTAFSAEQLQQVGANSDSAVALLTVNFNTVAQLGRRLDRPVIRGQAAPAVGGEPNASYFIDGAFVSGSIATTTLGPVERVEILRGPQSAQFGRATFAGAVNYVTRQPTNELEGEAHAVTGTNDTLQIGNWVSGPIIEDKLAFFAAAGLDKYGGEWRNDLQAGQAQQSPLYINPPQFGDNSKLGKTETKDVTGKLLWTPNDGSAVTLKLGYSHADDGHYAQSILEPGELNCYLPTPDNADEPWYATSQGAYCGSFDIDKVKYAAGNPFANPANRVTGSPNNGDGRQARFNLPDFYTGMKVNGPPPPALWQTTPVDPGATTDQFRSLLQYEQDIGSWTATTRAAFNTEELEANYDLDQTEKRPLLNVFAFSEIQDVDDESFELRFDSPAENRLRGSVGSYLFHATNDSKTHSAPGFAAVDNQFVGLAQYRDPTTTDIDNKSIFGLFEFDVSDKLTFITEARYANDKKTIESPYQCNDPNSPYFGQAVNDSTDQDSFTPRFTLDYQATDDAMVYMLAAKGTKPAEFNSGYFRITADPCASLAARDNPASLGDSLTHTQEEEAWTYEVGGKTTWLDGQLLANLSVFYIDWTNQATFQTVNVGSVIANVQRNAGKSEVYGLEFESSLAITSHLGASFAYGLANGKYLDYTDPFYANTTGIGLDANGNLINGSNNVAGHSIPNNPKHSFVTALTYARDINTDLGWFARTDFVLESKRYVDAANFMTIPNRQVWNGRIGLESAKWTVTAYIDNILDEQTPTAIPNFLYFPDTGVAWDKPNCATTDRCWVESWAASPSQGLNWGLDLLYRFGAGS